MSVQKEIRVLVEESAAGNIWCRELTEGLTKELKKRRMICKKISTTKEITGEDIVFVIGAQEHFVENAVFVCNAKGIVPILLSNHHRTYQGRYHLVYADVEGAMEALCRECRKAGRERIALYGIQGTMTPDIEQMRNFSKVVKDVSDIYMNNGNLETCFLSFLPYAERYDAVICVSGYAAVSLVKKLEVSAPETLEKLVIVSFEEILLSAHYKERISFVDLKLEGFGATALAVMELAQGKKDISAIQVSIEAKICEIPEKESEEVLTEESEEYLMFADPEVVCMARVEQLLQDSDEMDRVIIEMLLNNAKYSEIAEACFMTEGNVKYRVKKYLSICKVATKRELQDLLTEYLR